MDFDSLEEVALKSAFSKIDPHSNAPLLFNTNKYANWLQFWEYYRARSKECIAKIVSQLIFVEADLVALITAIDDCPHFVTVKMVVQSPIRNLDLTAFAGSFFKYCLACKELDDYLKKLV